MEPGGYNKRVVSLLIDAVSSGQLTAFDELYTPRAAAKAAAMGIRVLRRKIPEERHLGNTGRLGAPVIDSVREPA